MSKGKVNSKDSLALEYFNRGRTLARLRKAQEAINHYQKAVSFKPDFAEAHDHLGNLFAILGNIEKAVESYKEAISCRPDFARAHYNLGNACRIQKQLDEAVACFEKAITIRPDYTKAHYNMAKVLARQGRLDYAVASFRRAVTGQPRLSRVHSDLLFVEQSRPGNTAEKLYKIHREWDERQAKVSKPIKFNHINSKDPEKCLKIGFVSADLRRHPVGYFVVLLFENLCKSTVKSFIYSDRRGDSLTKRIRASSHVWRHTRKFSDNQLFNKVIDDGIDILIDLAGHTGGNRLPVFFRKPAPLQVTWAGYTGTTGLSAMDYLIADPHSIPRGEEKYSSEAVIRMPHCYVSYSPVEYAPVIQDLPYSKNSFITFGSLNHPRKLNPYVLDVWSRILDAIPNSQLLLKYKSMDAPHNLKRFTSTFYNRGIDVSRIILEGGAAHKEFLESYNKIDIALDPFPYSGGLTTLECLWMGVPVITLPGETFAGRHTLAYLSTLQLGNLIASEEDDYVAIAKNLSKDITLLKTLRSSLRERMENSPICDGAKFAKDFTNLMKYIWRARCLRIDN